jgi:DNA-binding CsgD family transcriptional regulator
MNRRLADVDRRSTASGPSRAAAVALAVVEQQPGKLLSPEPQEHRDAVDLDSERRRDGLGRLAGIVEVQRHRVRKRERSDRLAVVHDRRVGTPSVFVPRSEVRVRAGHDLEAYRGAVEGWPLVGRDEEMRVLRDALASTGALIAGEAGVGKSRLAAELIDEAELSGRPAARCVANRSTLTVPFGAMVHLLPPLRERTTDVTQVLATARQHLTTTLRDGVLLVDDAHLLDHASAALVQHVVRDGHVTVLLVVRSSDHALEAVDALWKEGLIERIDLQPLSREETRQILAEVCRGAVSDQAVNRFYATSSGNALFLRELVLEARTCGELVEHDGVWWWSGTVRATPRLTTVVERRTEQLTPATRRVLELVAMVEPLPLALVERLTHPSDVEAAERSGVVSVGPDGDVRVAHPLFGEVVYAQIGTSARRRNLAALAGAMLAADSPATPAQQTRLAILHLESGQPVAADLLTAGARHAIASGDSALGERLARAAVEVDPSSYEAGLPLGLALINLKRHTDAVTLLAALEGREPDQASIAELAYLRMGASLFGGIVSASEARAIIVQARARLTDPSQRSRLDSALAEIALNESDLDEARRLAEVVLDTAGATDEALLLAAHMASLADTLGGRAERGLATAERFWPLAVRAAVDVPSARGWMLLDRWLGLVHGGRLHDALGLCEELTANPAAGAPGFEGSVALLQGRVHLLLGRPATAEVRLREAVGVLRLEDPRNYLEWALGLLGAACALQGRTEDGRRAYDESQRGPDGFRRLFDADRLLASAWVLAAEGQVGAARLLADELGVAAIRAGQLAFGILALHDALRLGSSTSTVPLAEAADRCGGPLAAAIGAHARAALSGDAGALSAAGEALVAIGLRVAGAEAHLEAAAAYHDEGRESSARATSARADAILATCEGIRTPVTVGRVVTGAHLTDRELEIAWLAAGGASNREIAARLVTSTRTVEGHLLRAYRKLGVARRQDLRGLLGPEPPGNA